MITLPTLPTSVTSDTSTDTSTSGESLLAAGDTPKEFLTLLGNRLLTLAQQSGGTAVASAQLGKGEAKGQQQPVTELSELMAALDKPETLNALLQTENVKGNSKSADDKDKLAATDLSDSDMQTLQALFAMLPQAPVQQLATAPAAAQSALIGSGTGTGTGGSADKNGVLAAALSSLSAKTAAGDDVSNSATTPLTTSSATDGKNPATALHSLFSANSSNNQTATDTSASSAFQQALSSFTKEEPLDQSPQQASSVNLSAVVSSASMVTTTPTASATSLTPATPQLNSQLGSPEWQQALSQQVLMFSRNGQQTAELRLHPQDLGSIQISLKLDNDQAQLNMVSGHSQVRAALEAALPQLRTALAESGINLGQTNVSSDAFPQSQSFSGQQESRRDGGHGSFAQAMDNDSEITPIAVPAALQARAAGSNAVDIFA
ncbi:flagellar hook-length control protein FliK [Erwiniaceae bacterium BAC15a-03b]|uniref:Flagellar hook-length control protein FliK n=1 Tax=Winslowiella arboricola TaxID=2978220 RepID=A0A9J6PP22_9GAMM|nr:flagellar hook-length control protein FliK [Winslowiella arboricola]MCU5773276.1 flagellar hook-length control protein FliK [Winslowiella arboricola]MCU5779162.1 flagellar hook-length control protein FliK [Winslowiella arboricola]